jgi:hypothetical protein
MSETRDPYWTAQRAAAPIGASAAFFRFVTFLDLL